MQLERWWDDVYSSSIELVWTYEFETNETTTISEAWNTVIRLQCIQLYTRMQQFFKCSSPNALNARQLQAYPSKPFLFSSVARISYSGSDFVYFSFYISCISFSFSTHFWRNKIEFMQWQIYIQQLQTHPLCKQHRSFQLVKIAGVFSKAARVQNPHHFTTIIIQSIFVQATDLQICY